MAVAVRPATALQSPVAVDENASGKPRANLCAQLLQSPRHFSQAFVFAVNKCKYAAECRTLLRRENDFWTSRSDRRNDAAMLRITTHHKDVRRSCPKGP
ncbi:hypothetical protein FBT96_19860 [Rhodobacter capsulatus]|uniref:Uncharacterized protein n=1 Tax=Rhodobacter capsulatus TaxID=1061 RepID=A0A4U1JLV6_RHOCA|nr:hypothetical protein [Rhodobacter capsulatus]TKD12967.1 hypothetical protein FBT96_19860 [Rhodobacter capsulatus]